MTVPFEVHNCHDGNKNNLRTIEAQIVQNLKKNVLGQNLLVFIKKKLKRVFQLKNVSEVALLCSNPIFNQVGWLFPENKCQ